LLLAGIVDEMELTSVSSQHKYRWTVPEAVNRILYAPDDGRKSRPKGVDQTRKKQIKNSCILLVVIYNYTSDAGTHERQK
jgi:hypothetical protein